MRRLSKALSIPLDFWRDPRATIQDWRTRRSWPGRQDFDRMDSEAFNRYLTSLGIGARVDEPAVRDRPISG